MWLKTVLAIAAMFLMTLFMRGLTAQSTPEGSVVSFVPTLENGDWNGDGYRNITDVVGMVTCLYLGGVPPAACECYHPNFSGPSELLGVHCDIDGDGTVNITDVVRFATWLYMGGPPPVELECTQPF